MAKKQVKLVTVGYTLFGDHPNNKKIEQAIEKWMAQGYELHSRQENTPSGCARIFSLLWARGRTELTFIKTE